MLHYKCYDFFSVADDTKILPSRMKGNLGNRARMGCISKGETRWYYKSTDSPPISRNNVLSLKELTLDHAGHYFCYGLFFDRLKHFLAKSYMKVYGKLRLL